MKSAHVYFLGLVSLGSLIAAGCGSSNPGVPAASQPVAAETEPSETPVAEAPASGGPPAAMVAAPAAKDLTHVLTQDEAYFAKEPAEGATPSLWAAGTLKAGTKVLLLIPGAEYSQVVTETGISAFTFTEGLKPLAAEPEQAAVVEPAAAAGPPAEMVAPPAAKDLTHVLTEDEPYFAKEPALGATPSLWVAGTLKAGTKVLLLIPGSEYSQIVSETGISAFTVTAGLKPIGK